MRGLIALLASLAAPGEAAERRWPVGSIERVRVEAPVAVRIVTGGGTGVSATAADRAALEAIDVRVDGTTLTLRARQVVAGEVVIRTPRVDSVAVTSAATVAVDAMRGSRVTASMVGAGTLSVGRIEADTLSVALVGEGEIAAAGGSARDARVTGQGPGTIDLARVATDRLAVQAAGDIIVRAAARDSAQVTAGPDAQVAVAGRARCTVRAPKTAVVRCGER
ncbi:GIN domain-containing protein [Sphingomonas endophytica]|uniref:Putative auto-transporter adhesin head GIN domain-containing protein n=1 Tax=Sphingomonas endophytica TaxID=869719 RepID=A0A147I7U6_9SPHN|nr:DUF2807 domain-containing protein [Sphingomonas endophytica]KTT75227.1 hypothetical protein NS334_02855 [Sphingomonas endophytica]